MPPRKKPRDVPAAIEVPPHDPRLAQSNGTALPQQRILMRITFFNACASSPTWGAIPPDTQYAYIRRIERECFNAVVDYCTAAGIERKWTEKKFADRYSTVCSSILYNLDINSSIGSDYLINNLLSGGINVSDLPFLSAAAMAPAASQEERDMIALRQQQKVDLKVTKDFKCGNCGSTEATLIEYQARSADEPSNFSIKCVRCGKTRRI